MASIDPLVEAGEDTFMGPAWFMEMGELGRLLAGLAGLAMSGDVAEAFKLFKPMPRRSAAF